MHRISIKGRTQVIKDLRKSKLDPNDSDGNQTWNLSLASQERSRQRHRENSTWYIIKFPLQEQYKLLHEALFEALMYPGSAISVSDFPKRYEKIKLGALKKENSTLSSEFKVCDCSENYCDQLIQDVP